MQLSQKLTGQKASVGPVNGEPGAMLKSQRREPENEEWRKLSHACRQMRRKQSLSSTVSASVSCGIKEATNN